MGLRCDQNPLAPFRSQLWTRLFPSPDVVTSTKSINKTYTNNSFWSKMLLILLKSRIIHYNEHKKWPRTSKIALFWHIFVLYGHQLTKDKSWHCQDLKKTFFFDIYSFVLWLKPHTSQLRGLRQWVGVSPATCLTRECTWLISTTISTLV